MQHIKLLKLHFIYLCNQEKLVHLILHAKFVFLQDMNMRGLYGMGAIIKVNCYL